MEHRQHEHKSISERWIDITNPTQAELDELSSKYKLHPNAVQDCLKPDHLPKYEEIEQSKFIVSRIYDINQSSDADTIQEVSRKVSIFITHDIIITIHRTEQPVLSEIRHQYIDSLRCTEINQLLMIILNKVLLSYESPALKLNDEIDFYENKIFLKNKLPNLLKNLYRIKRKVSVNRRILTLTKDIINKLEIENHKNVMYRELQDTYVQQETIYDQLNDDINNVLQLYLSISSQKTNEVIRVLTIFSVFFMPLTFIVGIYGMNFHFMPELEWKFGYLFSILIMVAVTVIIYLWFKKKDWL
ncbi:MAG: CorA family divalent cation transporter [bacterium]|jgi:magnesium transporter